MFLRTAVISRRCPGLIPVRKLPPASQRALDNGCSILAVKGRAMTIVTSPMVGKILNIQVKVGDKVNEDDTIIVMEAMKMEIPIVAPASGTIKEIKVAVGDMVESESVVALME